MLTGISVSWRDIPEALIERHSLQRRVIVRNEGAEREIRFLQRERPALIPAWCKGELLVCSWGVAVAPGFPASAASSERVLNDGSSCNPSRLRSPRSSVASVRYGSKCQAVVSAAC